jgi:hypothetical protein
VLASPHRFMLVSDLDWTMVRPLMAQLPRSGSARSARRNVQGKLAADRSRAAPAGACRSSTAALLPSPPPAQVDHNDGTHDKLRAFNRLWLSEFAADSLLVFSTGRSPELFHELAVRCLAPPRQKHKHSAWIMHCTAAQQRLPFSVQSAWRACCACRASCSPWGAGSKALLQPGPNLLLPQTLAGTGGGAAPDPRHPGLLGGHRDPHQR